MDSVQESAHQTLVDGTIKPDFGYTHEYTISLYRNIRTGPRWIIISHESAFSSVLVENPRCQHQKRKGR